MALDPPPQRQAIGVQGGGGGADDAAAPWLNRTPQDAKSYLKQVKRAFANKAGKYATFRDLLIDFNNGRIDAHVVLVMVKVLLQGHSHLVDGFNTFLPEKDRIKLDEDEAGSKQDDESG